MFIVRQGYDVLRNEASSRVGPCSVLLNAYYVAVYMRYWLRAAISLVAVSVLSERHITSSLGGHSVAYNTSQRRLAQRHVISLSSATTARCAWRRYLNTEKLPERMHIRLITL
jgi:hypothetical protein